MPSKMSEIAFSEPSGRPTTVVQFGGSFVFVGLYVYSEVIASAGPNSWLLLMAVGFALAGSAESLPKNRHQSAGILRLAAIVVFLSLVAATVFVPDFITG